jgi:hypothetical protein
VRRKHFDNQRNVAPIDCVVRLHEPHAINFAAFELAVVQPAVNLAGAEVIQRGVARCAEGAVGIWVGCHNVWGDSVWMPKYYANIQHNQVVTSFLLK